MPFNEFPSNLRCYTAKEIDQMFAGGAMTQLASRNAMSYLIASGSWTQEATGGHRALGWYYADITHGRTSAGIVTVIAFEGLDGWIYPVGQSYQQKQDAETLRLWIPDEPAYDILALLVYA